jgi:O-antigen ligase
MGLVALFMFLKTSIKGEIVLIILLVGVFFIEQTGVMEGQYLGGRDRANQEESSMSRKILWQAGIAIALDNPVLGIGGDQYGAIASQYTGQVDKSLLEWEESRYWGYSSLGSEAPHNDFLGVWVRYGTLAFIVYLWIMMVALRNFLYSYRASKQRFIKGLSIGLAAGLIVYMVNAFYHNCLQTYSLFWILTGFSVATAKLAAKKKVQIPISKIEAGSPNPQKG